MLVRLGVRVRVGVGVLVGVRVLVAVLVSVMVGVKEGVKLGVMEEVMEGVRDGVRLGVKESVLVNVAVSGWGEGDVVGVGMGRAFTAKAIRQIHQKHNNTKMTKMMISVRWSGFFDKNWLSCFIIP